MFEAIILGGLQGISEWLPVSSEGLLIFVRVNLFKSGLGLSELINYALFLHLGTFFAALIYFRRELSRLIKGLFRYRAGDEETKKLLNFYILATLFSGLVALIVLWLLKKIEGELTFTGRWITLMIGMLLLVTALLQFKKKGERYKGASDLKTRDGIILGVLQGISILPGLSRSGLTVSAFLLRKFDDSLALKLSFLMSLPVVLAGNILLNLKEFVFTLENFIGFAFSFLLGLLTIYILLGIAKKLNFSWFVLIFAILVILSVFI